MEEKDNNKAELDEELKALKNQVRDLKQELETMSQSCNQPSDAVLFNPQTLQAAPIAVFMLKEGFVVACNAEMEKIHSLSATQLKTDPYINLVFEEDREMVNRHVAKQLAAEAPLGNCIHRIHNRNIHVKWVESKTMRMDSPGQTTIVCFQIDISERHNTDENLELYREHLEESITLRTAELKKALEEANKANQIKDTFLQNMSHEFRTPVHHISSFSKLGLKRTENASGVYDSEYIRKLSNYFKSINEAGENLHAFIVNLFDLSLLDSRQNSIYLSEYNLMELAKIAGVNCRAFLVEKEITFDVSGSDEIKVECDQNWIIKAFKHLIGNAVKFSPKGSQISLAIQDCLFEGENVIRVSVTDQGIGIPEEELGNVFEKFTQSSLTEDGSGGKGIGLAICKRIIEGHFGKIWIESNQDQGVTVIFTLPARQPDASKGKGIEQKSNDLDQFNKIGFDEVDSF